MIVATLAIAFALAIIVTFASKKAELRVLGFKVAVDSLAATILGLSPKGGESDSRLLAITIFFSGTIIALFMLYGFYRRRISTQSFSEQER